MAVMTQFDPGQVMMGGAGRKPYLPLRNPDIGNYNAGTATANGGPQQVPIQQPPTGNLGAETVRATGKGPFDAAYRQNLATYSGGQFARPGGNMSFNPTDASTFPGNPTGAGNAPLPGLPDSLISRALGGNPFSFAAPTPPSPVTNDTMGQPEIPDWRTWLQQFRNQGRGFGLNLQ
jgi:hypothetical protein